MIFYIIFEKMLVVTIQKDGIDLFEPIIKQYPDSIDIDEIEYSFDGTELLQVFLEITQLTLPIIASILISKQNKGRIVEIKNGDKEIKVPINEELSLEETMLLLEKCFDDED